MPSSYLVVAHDPYAHDRNRGQGLPSGISDESYRRLLRVTQPQTTALARTARRAAPAAPLPDVAMLTARRFASLAEVERGFRRIASGCYVERAAAGTAGAVTKTAHPIWELRAAEDDSGFVLVRQREERAVDLRQAGADGPAGIGTSAAVAAGIIRQAAPSHRLGPGHEGKLRAWDALSDEDIKTMSRGEMLRYLEYNDPNGEWSDLDPSVSDDEIREEFFRQRRGRRRASATATATAGLGMSKTARRVRAEQHFLVSLLQTPGGDLAERKVVFSNQLMDLDALQRLVSEVGLVDTKLVHDTWSDGEWELRVRGPKGQLIHDFESVGPEEIGGSKGQALLDILRGIIPNSPLGDGGLEGEAEGGGALLGEGDVSQGDVLPSAPPSTAGAPPPGPGAPSAGPASGVAPSAAALGRGARRGSRVLVVKRGQVAEAVVMMVNPQQQAIEVMFGGGQREEVPMVDILDVAPPEEQHPDVFDVELGEPEVIIEPGPVPEHEHTHNAPMDAPMDEGGGDESGGDDDDDAGDADDTFPFPDLD